MTFLYIKKKNLEQIYIGISILVIPDHMLRLLLYLYKFYYVFIKKYMYMDNININKRFEKVNANFGKFSLMKNLQQQKISLQDFF